MKHTKTSVFLFNLLFLIILFAGRLSAQGGYATGDRDSFLLKLSERFNKLIVENDKTGEARKKQFVLSGNEEVQEHIRLKLKRDGNDAELLMSRYEATLAEVNDFVAAYNESQSQYEVYVYVEKHNDVDQQRIFDVGKDQIPDDLINNIPNLHENSNAGSNAYLNTTRTNLDNSIRTLLESSETYQSDAIRVLIGLTDMQLVEKSKVDSNYQLRKASLFSVQSKDGEDPVFKWNDEIANEIVAALTSAVGSNEQLMEFVVAVFGRMDEMVQEFIAPLDDVDNPNEESTVPAYCSVGTDEFGHEYFLVGEDCRTFVSPTGRPFKLPVGSRVFAYICNDPVKFTGGALFKFMLPDGTYYCGIAKDFGFQAGQGTKFHGYRKGIKSGNITRFSINNELLNEAISGITYPESANHCTVILLNESMVGQMKNVSLTKGKFMYNSTSNQCPDLFCSNQNTEILLTISESLNLTTLKRNCNSNGEENNSIDFNLFKIEIEKVLNNEFFQSVKQCIRLHNKTYQYDKKFCTPGSNDQNSDYTLDIEILDDGSIKTSVNPSENYLAEYVQKWQHDAANRGIEVDVEELRQQVIEDFKNAGKTDDVFYEKFITLVNELIHKKVGKFVEAIAVSQKISKNIWDEGTINKSLWHTTGEDAAEHLKWPDYVQVHPLVGGPIDGTIDEIAGIPMAVKGVYTIMTDEAQREALKNMFTAEGISQLIAGIAQEAGDIAGDEERVAHFGGKTVVSLAASFTGIGVISKTGKISETLDLALNSVKKGIKNSKVAKVLDDLRLKPKYFASRHQAITDFLTAMDASTLNKLADKVGFDKVIQEMSYSWKKHHAGKFIITNIKNKGDEFIENILKFESKIDDALGDFTADLVIKVGNVIKYVEFKSWKVGSFSLMNGEQFTNQLKTYISKGDFEYIFDKQKLILENVADPDLFVKGKFQVLFSNNNYAMFEDFWRSPILKEKLFGGKQYVDALEDYKEYVLDMDEKLFNVIKIE